MRSAQQRFLDAALAALNKTVEGMEDDDLFAALGFERNLFIEVLGKLIPSGIALRELPEDLFELDEITLDTNDLRQLLFAISDLCLIHMSLGKEYESQTLSDLNNLFEE